MLCRTVRKKLKAYSDGEMKSRQQRRIAGHLRSCAGCAAEAERLAAAWEALTALADTGPCPDLTDRVVRRIAIHEQEARAWYERMLPHLRLTFAHAAVCAMVLGFCTGFLGSTIYPLSWNTSLHVEAAPEGDQYLDAFSELPSGLPGSIFASLSHDEGEE